MWQNATGGSSLLCCNVNNCGYDLTGAMLRSFFGTTVRPRTKAPLSSGLWWVEQWKYLPAAAGDPRNSTMLRWAPVYVPRACASRLDECRVHVNYHGCTSNPRSSSMADWYERLLWLRNIDLNEYAEANELIVVYPQAAGSEDIGEGCFNWASYEDDPLFDTKHGVELNTVVALVNDLPNALYGNATRAWSAHEWSAPPALAPRSRGAAWPKSVRA